MVDENGFEKDLQREIRMLDEKIADERMQLNDPDLTDAARLRAERAIERLAGMRDVYLDSQSRANERSQAMSWENVPRGEEIKTRLAEVDGRIDSLTDLLVSHDSLELTDAERQEARRELAGLERERGVLENLQGWGQGTARSLTRER